MYLLIKELDIYSCHIRFKITNSLMQHPRYKYDDLNNNDLNLSKGILKSFEKYDKMTGIEEMSLEVISNTF